MDRSSPSARTSSVTRRACLDRNMAAWPAELAPPTTWTSSPAQAGEDVHVVGGANSAGQAAMFLSRHARRVTLLVRADGLERSMSSYLIRQIRDTPNIQVRPHTQVVEA